MPHTKNVIQQHLLSTVGRRPKLSATAAGAWLERDWGFTMDLRALESERDQNWMASVNGKPRFVLKVANADDDRAVLSLQQLMLARAREAGLPCPDVVHTKTNEPTATWDGNLGWLITALPGHKLVDEPAPSQDLFNHLGVILGRLTNVLADVEHPAAHRRLQWDVVHADEVLTTYRSSIIDPHRGRLADVVLEQFREVVAPVLGDLPRSLIHNDANDHNILVQGDRVSGLIDFGDSLCTVTINDLAIACSYAMLGREAPWDVAAAITAGYCAEREVSPLERDVLTTLILTRLATSVSISAHQQVLEPDNPYLRISEQPVWDLLATLLEGTQQ